MKPNWESSNDTNRLMSIHNPTQVFHHLLCQLETAVFAPLQCLPLTLVEAEDETLLPVGGYLVSMNDCSCKVKHHGEARWLEVILLVDRLVGFLTSMVYCMSNNVFGLNVWCPGAYTSLPSFQSSLLGCITFATCSFHHLVSQRQWLKWPKNNVWYLHFLLMYLFRKTNISSFLIFIYSQTCHKGHLYQAVTCIKRPVFHIPWKEK